MPFPMAACSISTSTTPATCHSRAPARSARGGSNCRERSGRSTTAASPTSFSTSVTARAMAGYHSENRSTPVCIAALNDWMPLVGGGDHAEAATELPPRLSGGMARTDLHRRWPAAEVDHRPQQAALPALSRLPVDPRRIDERGITDHDCLRQPAARGDPRSGRVAHPKKCRSFVPLGCPTFPTTKGRR